MTNSFFFERQNLAKTKTALGFIACSSAPKLLRRHRSHWKTGNLTEMSYTNYNLRIIQEYFQPKIGRKTSLARKNNILI